MPVQESSCSFPARERGGSVVAGGVCGLVGGLGLLGGPGRPVCSFRPNDGAHVSLAKHGRRQKAGLARYVRNRRLADSPTRRLADAHSSNGPLLDARDRPQQLRARRIGRKQCRDSSPTDASASSTAVSRPTPATTRTPLWAHFLTSAALTGKSLECLAGCDGRGWHGLSDSGSAVAVPVAVRGRAPGCAKPPAVGQVPALRSSSGPMGRPTAPFISYDVASGRCWARFGLPPWRRVPARCRARRPRVAWPASWCAAYRSLIVKRERWSPACTGRSFWRRI